MNGLTLERFFCQWRKGSGYKDKDLIQNANPHKALRNFETNEQENIKNMSMSHNRMGQGINNIVKNITIDMNLQEVMQQNKVLINQNELLKKTIHEFRIKEDESMKKYKIEKMTTETLQEHLKSLEEDCGRISREGDVAMQNLKEESRNCILKHITLAKRQRLTNWRLRV